jgi:hypothetical protein
MVARCPAVRFSDAGSFAADAGVSTIHFIERKVLT